MTKLTRLLFLILIVCISGCIGVSDERFGDNLTFIDQESRSFGVSPDSVYARLTASGADTMLGNPHLTVTDKSKTGIVQDPQLYVSLTTYCWPDPDSEDGLPYIRRDGVVNPEATMEQSDLPRMIEMAQRVELLAGAYDLSGEEKYARSAIAQLNAWFIDEKTAMYPHLEHAQMVRGLNRGRS